MDIKVDALGRRIPMRPVSTGKRVDQLDRDLFTFFPLHIHGPLPTPYLLEYAKVGGKICHQTTRKRLKDLVSEYNNDFGKPFLRLPDEQIPELPGGYIPRNLTLVYNLAEPAMDVLKKRNLWYGYKNGGPFYHQLMLACTTASLELAAFKTDITYLPEHLAIPDHSRGATVAITHTFGERFERHSSLLIPDALFALVYPSGKRRFVVVEADRSTEMVNAKSLERKTLLRTILQYKQFVSSGQYKKEYGLGPTDGFLVLIPTTTKRQEENIKSMILQLTGGKGLPYICPRFIPEFEGRRNFTAKPPIHSLFTTGWPRAGRPDFFLNNPESH